MPPLRCVLFVEGSQGTPDRQGRTPLERIWNEHAVALAQIATFDRVVPISKKHLVALDPDKPKMSGSGEPLDALITRELARRPFDAAVVAWDLIPEWAATAPRCRWQETLDLYRWLAASNVLPQIWRDQARARHHALAQRPVPGARRSPVRPQEGMVLPLCMDPMFEGLLVEDERLMRRVLGVRGYPRGWPTTDWGRGETNSPDSVILEKAVAAFRAIRPRPGIVSQIPGGWQTNKDGWGEYFLRQLRADVAGANTLRAHPIVTRLAEIGCVDVP